MLDLRCFNILMHLNIPVLVGSCHFRQAYNGTIQNFTETCVCQWIMSNMLELGIQIWASFPYDIIWSYLCSRNVWLHKSLISQAFNPFSEIVCLCNINRIWRSPKFWAADSSAWISVASLISSFSARSSAVFAFFASASAKKINQILQNINIGGRKTQYNTRASHTMNLRESDVDDYSQIWGVRVVVWSGMWILNLNCSEDSLNGPLYLWDEGFCMIGTLLMIPDTKDTYTLHLITKEDIHVNGELRDLQELHPLIV